MATTVADPPGYNISEEEEQQQQHQHQQQEEEEYNARRRKNNSMFVDDLRFKKRHLEAKQQQQRDVIIAAQSSGWVPERLKTIDRDPNQPKNRIMSQQTKEIHRNSIPRTSWEPYTIPKKQTKNVDNDLLKSKAFSSTTNDWVPSKYYNDKNNNNNNQNLHPQLNRNNVVTSSYPPIPLVATPSNSTASESTTLANNNSINNISRTNAGTVSSSNSDIDYDIETVNSDSFDEYTEYNDKSTANSNVLLTDHFKVNDDGDAGVSFTVDKAKIDVSKRSLITTDFTDSFAFTSFNTTGTNKDKTSSDDSSSSYLVVEISDCSSGGDNFTSFASFPSAAVAAPAPGAARSSTDPPTTTASAAAALAAWSARSLYSSSSSSSSSSPNNDNDNDNEKNNDNSTNDNNSNNSGSIPQSVSTLIMIKRKRDFLDFRCCCRVIDDDDDDNDDNGGDEQDNSSDDDDDDDDDEKENNGDRRQRNQRQRQRQRHGRICQPLSCGVWMIVSLSIVLLLIWIAIGIGWYFMKPFE